MNNVNTKENINSYYTTETKIKKPERIVVQGPTTLPKQELYTDKKADAKLKAIEQDIFSATNDVKKQNNNKKKFLGLF